MLPQILQLWRSRLADNNDLAKFVVLCSFQLALLAVQDTALLHPQATSVLTQSTLSSIVDLLHPIINGCQYKI